MNRYTWHLVVLLGFLAVGGCAVPKWQHLELSRERWRQDIYECRRQAFHKAERDRDTDAYQLARPEEADPGSWRGLMTRHRAALYEEKLFERCMRVRGYKKVGPARALTDVAVY